MRKNAQFQRIEAIIGNNEDSDFDEDLKTFYKYLKTHLSLPCEVTGIEDFGWEEFYYFGPGDNKEYEYLKRTQPSFTDHYELLKIVRQADPQWGLCEDDIGAHVSRISDGKKFSLGLSEIKATDKKTRNYQLLDDYSVWFVNSR